MVKIKNTTEKQAQKSLAARGIAVKQPRGIAVKQPRGKVVKPPKGKGKVPRKKLATKRGPTKKQATSRYSRKKQVELKAMMSNDCHYCGFRVDQRTSMTGHLLHDCKGMTLHGRLQEALQKIRANKKTSVLPGTYKWKACPEGGLADISVAPFEEGTICCPFNYVTIAMDKADTKGVSRIRASGKAFMYTNGAEERKRYYTDRVVHDKWEELVGPKIEAGEVKEILIPVTFVYCLERELKNLHHKNHVALIVVKITDKKWKASYYDSQEDDKYYQKAAGQDVRKFIVRRVLGDHLEQEPKEDPKASWLEKMPVYCSLSGNGCAAVGLFWVHLRYLGKNICNPRNTETVDFFKALLFEVSDDKNPNPMTRGDLFDLKWRAVSFKEYTSADPDPEMEDHVESFKAAIVKAQTKKEESPDFVSMMDGVVL